MADFEAQVARAGQVRAAMTQVQGHGRNQDGSVTVTVAPSGAVLGLRLTAEAMKRNHTQLQQEILAAIRQGTMQAAGAMEQAARPLLGDRYEDLRAAINAHAPGVIGPSAPPAPSSIPAAQPKPPRRTPRPAEPDEDYSNKGVLRKKP